MQKTTNRFLKLSVFIIGLIIITFLYVYSLKLYKNETTENTTHFSDSTKVFSGWLDVYANVIEIDPIKGDIKIRLDMIPAGDLTDNGSFVPNKNLTLSVNNNAGNLEYHFEKGKLISPIEITTSMFDGKVADYPFDKHKAELVLFLTTPRVYPDTTLDMKDSVAITIQDSLLALPPAIPLDIKIEFKGAVNGIHLTAHEDEIKYEDVSLKVVNMEIKRPRSVKAFSIFIMGAMIAIALIILVLIYNIIFNNRKVGLELFAFAAALLFALPALRDVQPGIPSIGGLLDYVAFFWAEGISALLLIISAIVWLIKEK